MCLETGDAEWMQLEGEGYGEASVAFPKQLREWHDWKLNAIWDNAPAQRGEALRDCHKSPGLNLRL